jgi:hypothetical protein
VTHTGTAFEGALTAVLGIRVIFYLDPDPTYQNEPDMDPIRILT